MVKPDGVQRNLTGEIIRRFEAKGYYLRYPLHPPGLTCGAQDISRYIV